MGKLIVIEGTDGSGKSTQFKALMEHLTTAAQGQNLTEQPEAGHLFRTRLAVGGYPVRRFTK